VQVMLMLSIIVGLVILGGALLAFALAVFRIGPNRWSEASELSGSMSTVLRGEVTADRDGIRDPRVVKGKVFKRATSSWKPQGKLSDEYLKNMVA
jgi:hypothetical protein